MQIRLFPLVALLLLCALPSLAQDTDVLSFGRYAITYPSSMGPHISIDVYAGDALDEEPPSIMLGWQAPFTQFALYSARSSRPQLSVQFTRTDDLVGYTEEASLIRVRELLENRPDLKAYEGGNISGLKHDLPESPGSGAVQILIARAEYVETENFEGIGYVTVYVQNDVPLASDSFRYFFFGVSKDDSTYVWMQSFLNTDLFPIFEDVKSDEASQEFYSDIESYFEHSLETLNAAPADAFTPSLDELIDVIDSIELSNG